MNDWSASDTIVQTTPKRATVNSFVDCEISSSQSEAIIHGEPTRKLSKKFLRNSKLLSLALVQCSRKMLQKSNEHIPEIIKFYYKNHLNSQ
jgi:hypothetical protein